MSDTPVEPVAPPPAAAFSQEDVDRISGRVRGETRATTQREVLAELGFDSIEAAKQANDERVARLEAEKTELQKAQDEALEAKREAENLRAENARNQLQVRVDRALLEAGIPTKTLNHASKLVEVGVDSTDEEIAAVIEALKSEVPQLFATPEDGAPSVPSGAPKGGTGGKKTKPTSKGGLDKGAELYESMFGKS